MRLKSFLLASASVVALSTNLLAADLPSKKGVPTLAAAPAFSWTGAYVGVLAGASASNSKTSTTFDADCGDPASCSLVTDPTSGLNLQGALGGTIGYNYQFQNNLVLGLEVDGSWLSAGQSHSNSSAWTYTDGGYQANSTSSLKNEVHANSLATARLRFGVALDRTLIFATAGVAAGRVKSKTTGATTFQSSGVSSSAFLTNSANGSWSGNNSKTRVGWTVGAGVEHAVTEHVTLKLDALYYNLGKVKTSATGSSANSCGYASVVGGCSDGGTSTTTLTNYTTKTTVDGVVARVGLNYKF